MPCDPPHQSCGWAMTHRSHRIADMTLRYITGTIYVLIVQGGVGTFLPSTPCLDYIYNGGRRVQSLQQPSSHPHPPPLPTPPAGKWLISYLVVSVSKWGVVEKTVENVLEKPESRITAHEEKLQSSRKMCKYLNTGYISRSNFSGLVKLVFMKAF